MNFSNFYMKIKSKKESRKFFTEKLKNFKIFTKMRNFNTNSLPKLRMMHCL